MMEPGSACCGDVSQPSSFDQGSLPNAHMAGPRNFALSSPTT